MLSLIPRALCDSQVTRGCSPLGSDLIKEIGQEGKSPYFSLR